MSDTEELRSAVEREVQEYSLYLERLKHALDVAPIVSARLQDAQAKLVLLNAAPVDFVDEFAPNLLAIQKEDDLDRASWLPHLPSRDAYAGLRNSSGTTSDFYATVITPISLGEGTPKWVAQVTETYLELADDKARSAAIPNMAHALDADLPELFATSLRSISKARHGLAGVDDACNRMRGFLQALWGTLAMHARQVSSDAAKPSTLERKKETHRDLVARALGGTKTVTLKRRLDDLDRLFRQLSSPAKEMLSADLSGLESFYAGWVLLVHEILSLVQPPAPE